MQEEKNTSIRKNVIVYKLCQVLKDVELSLTQFTTKCNTDIDNKLRLNDFGDSGFMLNKHMNIVPKIKEEKGEVEKELEETKLRNRYLEAE